MPDPLHPKLRDLSILTEVVRQLVLLSAEEKKRGRPWAGLAAEADRIEERLVALEKRIEDGH